jgi:hypothetical protein
VTGRPDSSGPDPARPQVGTSPVGPSAALEEGARYLGASRRPGQTQSAAHTDLAGIGAGRPLHAALAYAGRGWAAFPLHSVLSGRCSCRRECPHPAKHPIACHGLCDATGPSGRGGTAGPGPTSASPPGPAPASSSSTSTRPRAVPNPSTTSSPLWGASPRPSPPAPGAVASISSTPTPAGSSATPRAPSRRRGPPSRARSAGRRGLRRRRPQPAPQRRRLPVGRPGRHPGAGPRLAAAAGLADVSDRWSAPADAVGGWVAVRPRRPPRRARRRAGRPRRGAQQPAQPGRVLAGHAYRRR